MQHFVTVLTDTCKDSENNYVIHTLIHKLTYRIDIYNHDNLIDSIEETLAKSNKETFHKIYTKAHHAIKVKYCKQTIDKDVQAKNRPTRDKINFLPKEKIKIILLSMFALLLVATFFLSSFIYSRTYITLFYSDKKEKVTYLEKISNKTNILSEECIAIVKKQKVPYDIFTISQCSTWCKNKYIKKDTCTLFNSYKARNYPTELSNSLIKHVLYTILPNKDLILALDKESTIQVNNLHTISLDINVQKIVLAQSNNEEIIQFKNAISKIRIAPNEEKKFILFLEPSFYHQFKKGLYTGYIEFAINYKDKQTTFTKKFSFIVK